LSEPISFSIFVDRFSFEFDIPVEQLDPEALLVSTFDFDSLELLRLRLFLEMLLPGFELPDQLSLDDLRLQDVYHYYCLEAERVGETGSPVGGWNEQDTPSTPGHP
jgi:hypothetical protein